MCGSWAKIICGVNEIENESFTGKSIRNVIDQAGQLLNIPQNNLQILVNGNETSDTAYVIRSGDEVEFIKSAGEKGR